MRIQFFILFLLLSSVSAAAERAVSLTPAVTEALIEIGAEKNICGRSTACPPLNGVPEVGTLGYPDIESILKVRPTVVITDMFRPGNSWSALKTLKIPFLILKTERLSDHPENLRKLGRLFQRRAEAEKAASDFEKELADIRASYKGALRKALIVFSVFPVVSCSGKTFISEAVTLAGAENITAAAAGTYFNVSAEFIVKQQPEVIIIAGADERAVKKFFKRPEFRNVAAAAAERFITVDPNVFCRSGKALLPAVRKLQNELKKLKN